MKAFTISRCKVVPGVVVGKNSLALGESQFNGSVVRIPFSRDPDQRPHSFRGRLSAFSIGFDPMRGSREIIIPSERMEDSLLVRVRTRDTRRRRTKGDSISGGILIAKGEGFESERQTHPFLDALVLMDQKDTLVIHTHHDGVLETHFVRHHFGRISVLTETQYAEVLREEREARGRRAQKLKPTRMLDYSPIF